MLQYQQLLEFWFGNEVENYAKLEQHSRRWFKKSDAFDEKVRRLFGNFPDDAQQGAYDHWLANDEGRLAVVIGLDQFPRNMYRNTARSFRYDKLALQHAIMSIDSDTPQRLHPIQSIFLYMPLEHAEDIDMQNKCVAGLEALLEMCADPYREKINNFLDYALAHREVIERFGRFPHRNKILGRESTQQELTYLASGRGSF